MRICGRGLHCDGLISSFVCSELQICCIICDVCVYISYLLLMVYVTADAWLV